MITDAKKTRSLLVEVIMNEQQDDIRSTMEACLRQKLLLDVVDDDGSQSKQGQRKRRNVTEQARRTELRLLQDGSGPFRQLLIDVGAWDESAIPHGTRPLDYLQKLTGAPRALLIHGNYLDDEEIALLADNASTGYGTLARLREAAALAAAGNAAGAVAVLDRLAADADADPALRELAALLAVYQLMDSASRDELDGRLAPLLADDSPWHSSARELSGVLAFRGGETGRAREIFTAIVEDTAAPRAVRGRAAGMLAILGAPSGGG